MDLSSNAMIEWLSVMKILKIEIHLFRCSSILLFHIPCFIVSQILIILSASSKRSIVMFIVEVNSQNFQFDHFDQGCKLEYSDY